MNDPNGLSAALDTSANAVSLAVLDAAGTVRLEVNGRPLGRASGDLCGQLVTAFARAGLTLAEVRQWVVGLGPGSFSGIRVGAALIAGVSAATGAAVHGAPTSLALVRQAAAASDRRLTVLHHGGHGDVIVSDYCRAGAEWVPAGDARVVLAVDLPPAAADRFLALDQPVLLAVLPAAVRARTSVLASVSAIHFLRPTITAGALTPVYVRPPVFVPPLIPETPKP